MSTKRVELVEDTCQHPQCRATDDHPKFHLLVGTADGIGWQTMHHDCAAERGHTPASIIVRAVNGARGADLRALLTDQDHEVHRFVVEHTLRQAASIFVENRRTLGDPVTSAAEVIEHLYTEGNLPDSVVEHVANLVSPQMSAIKQGRATNFLNVELGAGSYTARTGAVLLELDTAVGSQAAAGTAVSGGSYADQTCAFGTASTQTGTYSGTIANSGTPTFTNMPAVTVTSIELKDSAGTPVRLQYGNLNSSKTTNSGDTVSVAVGAITVSI